MPHNYTFLPTDDNGEGIHYDHKTQQWGFKIGACVGPFKSLDEAIEEFIRIKERDIELCSKEDSDFVAWKVIGPSAAKYYYFKWK